MAAPHWRPSGGIVATPQCRRAASISPSLRPSTIQRRPFRATARLGLEELNHSLPAAAMNGFNSSINLAKPSSVSCCAPSLQASAGLGWTSISSPSAPIATAPLHIAVDQIRPPHPLARINNDRTMRLLLDDRNGGKVQRVAGVSLESADAPLAEHEIGVVVGQNVFARQQPFLDPHGSPRLSRTGFPVLAAAISN